MPRRFKESENPQKARTDWKKEQEARQPRRAPAGGRGGLLQNMMARRMGGGPGPGGGGPGGGLDAMRNHPAVGFGRQMTGGVGDGASAAIRNMVMQRLASKGMSQDATGTWQIAGLNRPSDPGLDIRNSAIAAMDPTGEMLRRVLGASPMPGGMRGMPSGMPGSGIPSPGLGAGSLPPGPQNGMPLPPVFPSGGPGVPGTTTTSSRPGTINGVPVPPGGGMQSVPPGLPGGPPMTPGTGGTVPSPGLGGGFPTSVPKLPPVAPPSGSPPFPPQGQGVGRTTTPTGAEIDPTRYPPTGGSPEQMPTAGVAGGLNQPAPSAPLGAPAQPRYIPTDAGGPAGQGGNGGLMSPPQPRYIPTDAGGPAGQGGNGMYPPVAALPPAGMAGGLNQAAPPPPAGNGQGPGGANIIQNPSPATSMPPPSVANNIYRQPGTPPVVPRIQGDGPAPGAASQPLPSPGGSYPRANMEANAGSPIMKALTPQGPWDPGQAQMQNAQAQGYANPGGPLTQRLQQGRPGTPSAPGRAPTPMVSPGAMPGQSTPFNPAQMAQQGMKLPPIPRPTQGAFGTPGQTQIPGARQPANLANLWQSIQATVASRVGAAQQGIRPGVSPATPGSPVGNSLDDLGERIRAAVAGNNGSVQPAAPSAGGTNLGAATTSIMDRVRQQLSQAGMPAGGMQNPNGTTPFPTPGGMTPAGMPAPGGPSTGTMPGAAPIPPGGVPSAMAAPSTTTAPAGGIGAPTGTINCQFGYGCGGDWSAVNAHDAYYVKYGQQFGVDPAMLKAMAVIESGGEMIPGPAGAYGVMQIKEGDWGWLANQLGVSLETPEGQIATAAAILGQYGEGSTPQERFLNSYYPTACYTCPPQDQDNGITQEVYWNNMQGLINDINGAGGGTTAAPTTVDPTTGQPTGQLPPRANAPINGGGPVAGEPGAMDPPAIPGTALNPAPTDTSLIPGMDVPRGGTVPPTQNPEIPVAMPPTGTGGGLNGTIAQPTGMMAPNGQPIGTDDPQSQAWADLIVAGGAANSGYGFGDDQGISMYCNYRDWSCTQHTGLDIGTGDVSAPVNSTSAGTVICYGEQSAANNPGVGCGSYTDSGGGIDGGYTDANGDVHSSGNISVLMPSGAVIIYGHLRSSNYGLGEQVPAGAEIGMSGYNNGYHVHAEVQLPIGDGGLYQLVDPDLYYGNYYCTAEYNGGKGFCAQ